MGHSGLAWQGAASQPERLKTQSQDTHSTHKPACDRPAVFALRDAAHTLPPVTRPSLEALNTDARPTNQLAVSPSNSDTLTEGTQQSQTSDTERATKETPPAPAEDTGLQGIPREPPPPGGTLSAERQLREIDSAHSMHAINQQTSTPPQSAECCSQPPLSDDSPAPRQTVLSHVQSGDTVRRRAQSQDALRPPQDDADGVRPAALLVSTTTAQFLRSHALNALLTSHPQTCTHALLCMPWILLEGGFARAFELIGLALQRSR